MSLTTLFDLCRMHSTPGDEDQVAAYLLRHWRLSGLQVEILGRYAITAQFPCNEPEKPRLLVCAHMDSPGYVVQSVSKNRRSGVAVPLGGPNWETDEQVNAAGLVKTANGLSACQMKLKSECRGAVAVVAEQELTRGDRVCFLPNAKQAGDMVKASFLDNRIGCHLLLQLAEKAENLGCQLILGATASEEFGGFGAAVLAAQVQADLVVCLDATYAEPEQGVKLGQGPVLTVSDASVLLGRKTTAALEKWAAKLNLPLQTEIYNFSGTDARAFPMQGSMATVLPLLVPTKGNHGPVETARQKDLQSTLAWLLQIGKEKDLLMELIAAGRFAEN